MKEQITVCQVQPELVWENIDANLEMLEDRMENLPGGIDLIVLPETFSTGFTMQADRFAEETDGKAVNWMKRMAREKQSCITGSLIIREAGQIFNRLMWITPDQIQGYYDKRHLFRMGREDQHFLAGTERSLFKLDDFRFMPQICYDLRFPVFSRNLGDYDVLFYVANWPASRQQVWETLLCARAIENQAYVLGTNRVGLDGLGMDHVGGTCAIDPTGTLIHRLDQKPGIQISTLDLVKLRKLRENFPVWKDADRFTID